MRNREASVFGIIFIAFYGVLCLGWCMNLYKTCQLDFESPFKAEGIRIIGVFTPISIVTGYMTFDEEQEDNK